MEKYEFTEDDFYAVAVAKYVARRFLKCGNISPRKIIGLGNAIYTLECLPLATAGVLSEFGIVYRSGAEEFSEMRYIDFRILESAFENSLGGSVYDKTVGRYSFSEPGWLIEIGGYRNTKCELYNLAESINEYLNIGAELTVSDGSEIELHKSHEKIKSFGQRKAPLVHRSAFCCR